MAKISNFRIGIFVLSALVLLAGMLYYLGLSDCFSRKAAVSTFFPESVQGLAVGAQVKYKGAQVGSVEKIVILPARKIIQVDMSVELDSFRNIDGSALFQDDEDFYRFLQKEIREGLRCRLEYAGITGLRFLDLDYFAASGEMPVKPEFAVKGFLLPSVPSALRDVVKSLNISLERISRIQFEEISNNLVRNLDDLNKILASEDVRRTISHLSGMAVSMDQTAAVFTRVVTEDRLRVILDDLESSLSELRTLAAVVRNEAEKSDFSGTAASVRQAADAFSGLLREETPEIKAAVDAWIRTLDMFRELADNLNRDPASLVRGRR